jgi:hypothetical protein
MYKGVIKRKEGNAIKATKYSLNKMGISPNKVRQALSPKQNFNATRTVLRTIFGGK